MINGKIKTSIEVSEEDVDIVIVNLLVDHRQLVIDTEEDKKLVKAMERVIRYFSIPGEKDPWK